MRTYLYLSYKCNCNCFFCASDETNMIKSNNEVCYEDAKRFLLNSPSKNKLIISGGEPTIHNDFLKIVKFAKQHYDHITLMTNGIKFSDMAFLKATIDAGVEKISIPFYSANENEHNDMVRNPNAFKNVIKGLSNINSLDLAGKVEVQIKLLLAKFTFQRIPNSIDFLAANFPNIKLASLNGFHIGAKALQFSDLSVINYNESRPYNDLSIKTLIKHNYCFQICDIPLCAFSSEMAFFLLKHQIVAHVDDAFIKRPNKNTKVVSSSFFCQKNVIPVLSLNNALKYMGKMHRYSTTE